MAHPASQLPGYTPKQAERLKRKIEREVAKIEDALQTLRTAVPDTDPNRFTNCGGGLDGLGEEARAVGYGLHEVIDRRRRSRF